MAADFDFEYASCPVRFQWFHLQSYGHCARVQFVDALQFFFDEGSLPLRHYKKDFFRVSIGSKTNVFAYFNFCKHLRVQNFGARAVYD